MNNLDTVRAKTVKQIPYDVCRVAKERRLFTKRLVLTVCLGFFVIGTAASLLVFRRDDNNLFAKETVMTSDKIELYEAKVEIAKKEYAEEKARKALAQEERMIANEQARVALERAKKEAEEAKIKAEQEKKVAAQIAAQVVSRRYVSNRKGGFDAVYAAAETKFGVSRHLLAAVHYVESGQSGDTSRSSYAGAQGPMQFMPGTFRAYGTDGDGDGVANIHDVDDAIFSAAKYLAANGAASGKVRNALYRYNHSYSYVEKVLSIARSFGFVD